MLDRKAEISQQHRPVLSLESSYPLLIWAGTEKKRLREACCPLRRSLVDSAAGRCRFTASLRNITKRTRQQDVMDNQLAVVAAPNTVPILPRDLPARIIDDDRVTAINGGIDIRTREDRVGVEVGGSAPVGRTSDDYDRHLSAVSLKPSHCENCTHQRNAAAHRNHSGF